MDVSERGEYDVIFRIECLGKRGLGFMGGREL
jgi:hypothetical protein